MHGLTIKMKLKRGLAVAFDFDGVIHKYSGGWKDGSIYDEANPEVINFMCMLMDMGIPVFILSTRDPEQISAWWNENDFPMVSTVIDDKFSFWERTDVVGVTRTKLPAQLYIDDRAYNYHGQSSDEMLLDFVK